jgi:outer membrane protein TolC
MLPLLYRINIVPHLFLVGTVITCQNLLTLQISFKIICLVCAKKGMYKSVVLVCFLCLSSFLFAQQKTLDFFLEQAYQNSPLIKDYNNQIRSNHIDSAIIRAGYVVQVNGNSINNYAPVIHGYGYEGAITNIANFSELITASKQFVGRGNLQNQFNSIELLNDSTRVATKISMQDLQKTITQQYIAAYGSWQQYSFNKEVYDLLSKEDTILKKLTQSTVYRQTDYLTFLVTLQQQKLTVLQAHTQLQNDYAQLNYLSGLVDTTLQPLTVPDITLNTILPADYTVYYRKFTIDSLILQNEHARINYSYRPKVNAYVDAGYVSTLTYQAYRNFGTSFGLNLTVPIYDGGQRKMQHRKLDIAEQTRAYYRDFFQTQYNQQLAQLMQQLNAAQQLIDESTNQLKYVEGLIKANHKLLAIGDVRIADYIIAINNYLNARNIITQNTINKLQLIAQINYWNKQ